MVFFRLEIFKIQIPFIYQFLLMKAHSKGKNYFQRSVAQVHSRNLSFDKGKARKGNYNLGTTQ